MVIEKNDIDDCVDACLLNSERIKMFKDIACRPKYQLSMKPRTDQIIERKNFLEQNKEDPHSIIYLPKYIRYLKIIEYGEKNPVIYEYEKRTT